MCALELFSESAFCFDVNEYMLCKLSACLFLNGYMYLDGICNDLIYVIGFPTQSQPDWKDRSGQPVVLVCA